MNPEHSFKTSMWQPYQWNAIDKAVLAHRKENPPYIFLTSKQWYEDVSPYCYTYNSFKNVTLDDPDRPQIWENHIKELNLLEFLAPWRLTKDIVTFTPELVDALGETDLDCKIPPEVFHRLPSWCVFFDVPIQTKSPIKSEGFFAYLSKSIRGEGLTIFFVTSIYTQQKIGITLNKDMTIKEALIDSYREMTINVHRGGYEYSDYDYDILDPGFLKAINLVLYLCTHGYNDNNKEQSIIYYPSPKKVKKGVRFFPAKKLNYYKLGETYTKRVKTSPAQTRERTTTEYTAKSPHIRRGHWHGFWHGPRQGNQIFKLQWLPPTIVGIEQ